MKSRMQRFRLLFSAFSILSLLLASQSIADGRMQTSQQSALRAAPAIAWNPIAWFQAQQQQPIPTSQKRRKTTLTALVTSSSASSTPSVRLLPAVDKKDIRANQRLLADTVLRALPSGCRDNLKNFYVRYDNPANRGLGGKTTIILDGSVPDTEFMALLTHECAHVIHSNLVGISGTISNFKDGKTPFRSDSPAVSFMKISWETENILRSDSSPRDFVSGYARSDAFEDFAETFAAYMLHPQALEAQARSNDVIAAKLAWMRTNLPMTQSISRSDYAWSGEIPWDITKLSYTWITRPVALK